MDLLATVIEQQQQRFELAGLPPGWLRLLGVLILVGLCVVVIWLYRHEARSAAPPRLRMTLAGLRIAVLLLLAAVWLEPGVQTYTRQTIRARVAVLVDVSESMAVADVSRADAAGQDVRSRLSAVLSLLGDEDHAWLRRIAARNELHVYAFGRSTRAVALPFDAGQQAAPDAAGAIPFAALAAIRDDATDVGSAITRVLADAGEQPIAAIILLTDGGFNQGLNVSDAAAMLRRSQAPAIAIGVGQETEPPQLSILSLDAPPAPALNDPFELRVALAASGEVPRRVRLELHVRRLGDPDGAGDRLAEARTLDLTGDAASTDARFTLRADAAGDFLYTARATTLPGGEEPPPASAPGMRTAETDPVLPFGSGGVLAVRSRIVRIQDDPLAVLLVASRPTRDFLFVKALLERDRRVRLGVWLQSAEPGAIRDGDPPLAALPSEAPDLLTYDVLVLMDPDPGELGRAWCDLASRLTTELGGGVLLQAGPLHTQRLLADDQFASLAALLPISPDIDADVRQASRGAYQTTTWTLEADNATPPHPLLIRNARLDPVAGFDEARTQATAERVRTTWATLPGPHWLLPVAHAKPLASVLLHAGTPDGPPLFVVQPAGSGRTAWLGFNETWRWRAVDEPHFNAFWSRALHWLADRRKGADGRRTELVVEEDAPTVGQPVRISARLLDDRYEPLSTEPVTLRIEPERGPARHATLQPADARPGWLEGRALLTQPGPTRLSVLVTHAEGQHSGTGDPAAEKPDHDEGKPDPGEGTPTAARWILVEPHQAEQRARRLNVAELQQLTARRWVPLDAAQDVPDAIADATLERPAIRGTWRPLWDSAYAAVAAGVLLAVEWALRRRSGLL
ncbi:MAG: VWA domain-containing protein [Phycisphaerae bacterium]|nr:VWA domain-containing protein [Phycisphaerae bacterium]MCZ2400726.1 VWA domain-containing protein [Phycisphaerae bacterium]NUQ50179.1 VWA domain-containing protein [Phycisphaerae bacterium]